DPSLVGKKAHDTGLRAFMIERQVDPDAVLGLPHEILPRLVQACHSGRRTTSLEADRLLGPSIVRVCTTEEAAFQPPHQGQMVLAILVAPATPERLESPVVDEELLL